MRVRNFRAAVFLFLLLLISRNFFMMLRRKWYYGPGVLGYVWYIITLRIIMWCSPFPHTWSEGWRAKQKEGTWDLNSKIPFQKKTYWSKRLMNGDLKLMPCLSPAIPHTTLANVQNAAHTYTLYSGVSPKESYYTRQNDPSNTTMHSRSFHIYHLAFHKGIYKTGTLDTVFKN